MSETLGPPALDLIGRFQADHAVLTIGAVDAAQGFMDDSIEEATVAQAMIRQSRAVTVLADHTKLGRAALIRVCGAEAVRRLVTGKEPPEPLRRALDQAEVEVLVAS